MPSSVARAVSSRAALLAASLLLPLGAGCAAPIGESISEDESAATTAVTYDLAADLAEVGFETIVVANAKTLRAKLVDPTRVGPAEIWVTVRMADGETFEEKPVRSAPPLGPITHLNPPGTLFLPGELAGAATGPQVASFVPRPNPTRFAPGPSLRVPRRPPRWHRRAQPARPVRSRPRLRWHLQAQPGQ